MSPPLTGHPPERCTPWSQPLTGHHLSALGTPLEGRSCVWFLTDGNTIDSIASTKKPPTWTMSHHQKKGGRHRSYVPKDSHSHPRQPLWIKIRGQSNPPVVVQAYSLQPPSLSQAYYIILYYIILYYIILYY